eukprot:TRINITY_DN98401_c0_g1_i1.p1 TRINITY_DN98401_c0_g1~~TRINITY_DN98401_c0_g1_i1.p1  ORF type:complete len:346 (-),score=30.57 TRINITY_DN98401_c0_g1_i1:3-1040(-)
MEPVEVCDPQPFRAGVPREGSLEQWQRGLIVKNRSFAASLLLSSTIAGFSAFAIALVCGNITSITGQSYANECFPHKGCDSNRSFHYETVSEMISEVSSPPQKVFQCLALIASILLLISRYPYELSNVWDGDLRLAAFRTVLPAIGMLIVAFVSVVPHRERTTLAIKIACSVHTFGAALFIAGYCALEARCLYTFNRAAQDLPLNIDRRTPLLSKWEVGLRCFALVSCFLCCVVFEVAGGLLSYADDIGIPLCCRDEFENTSVAVKRYFPNVTNSEMELYKQMYGSKVMVNTAYGAYLSWKKVGFWSEAAAGIFVLMSHFSIWLFSGARNASMRNHSQNSGSRTF